MAIQEQSVAQRGFTLLEMAVVIAIIAVVATFGIDIGRSAVRGSERITTQQRLVVIKQALDAYADRNGYYPCPASPSALPSAATFGIEQRTSNLTSTGAACETSGTDIVSVGSAIYIGMIPFRTLGLNDNYAADAWGSEFTYAISSNQIYGVGSIASSGSAGSIRINSGTRASPVVLTTMANGNSNTSASYVVVSHGRNLRGAYAMNGTGIPVACGSSTTLIDVENCDRANVFFYDSEYNEGTQASTQFDDMVVWGSKMLIRNPSVAPPTACPAGSCQPWCAPCEAARTSVTPSANTRLCAKFITDPTTCVAMCIWPNATTACP